MDSGVQILRVNTLVPRPKTWTGEGLPPVGIEIEAMLQGLSTSGNYAWRRALVVHGPLPDSQGEVLVFDVETTRPAWVDEFRPIRTPEQIAAEERKSDIQALTDVLRTINTTYYPDVAEAILLAGYRKQVAP
ncbi:hypothetical protein [Pseudomonas chlororaphis]|uniref:hypothetical protein n=1 Tax=Pseudomonas chlororaphis TaxID=587753 RepID=UPI002365E5B4|nr:hypothetical protein [Pseudomonas chlororaphis]WDG52445.1 hypothetical protein PUP76_21600 [Pseudomonas chlororaphis]WDH86538.1 hypothetical protein PUP74_20585 [Pseudomonas chlororaphis]